MPGAISTDDQAAGPEVARVLAALKGVRRTGDGWSALCPAHEDRNASLSVGVGNDGRALLRCHRGCTLEAICSAIGLRVPDLFPQDGHRAPGTSRKDGQPRVRGRIIAAYDYTDRDGALLFQCVRFEPKNFRQRRPDGTGGWIWNLKGVPRVLYNLPALITAAPEARIYIVEGEKDCEALARLGLLATTCPLGAGKWKHLDDDSALNGHPIVISPDRDDPGREHARDVATRLHGRVESLRILELPGGAQDVSDWLAAGGTAEALQALADAAPRYEPDDAGAAGDDAGSRGGDEEPPRKSQATALVELAAALELTHDDDVAYGTVLSDGRVETMPIRSKAFRRWLGRAFFLQERKAPNSQALADAINVIEGKACFEGPEVRVHLRIAEHEGAIYLDLADRDRNVARIDASGWEVLQAPPVRFRRPKAFRALPIPQRGGSMTALRRFIRVSEDDFILLAAWIVAAFRPDRPFPILAFTSEQGSGKSTAVRMLRLLIDPNTAPIRVDPREPRDLMIASNNAWVAAFDNLSNVSTWLSDAMCRLSTGGGLSTRMLYENDEECIFEALRPVIINGIEELGTRSDLLDRLIRITLPSIPEEERRPEDELLAEFERERPLILGAILDAVATALRRVGDIRLARYPRMADFAKWVTAAEPSMPWKEGEFMRAYRGQRESAHELALEASAIGEALRRFTATRAQWTGTAGALLKELNLLADDETRRRKDWPAQPNVLSGALRRAAPNLRNLGIEVEFPKPGHRGRQITIRTVAQNIVATVADRRTPGIEAAEWVDRDDLDWCRDDPATIDGPVGEDQDPLLAREIATATMRDDRDGDARGCSGVDADALADAEERAAIMEFDGGLSRDEAERQSGYAALLNGHAVESDP